MKFVLHSGLDVTLLGRKFAENGWVAIAPFIPELMAEALRDHMLKRNDWRLRLRDLGERLFELSPEEIDDWGPERIQAMRDLIAPQLDQKGFGYAHVRLRIIETQGTKLEAMSLLGEFGEFLCSETVLNLIRNITEERDINFADSFAARYDPGDYTTEHDDGVDERKAAYVFGLTKAWRADWGGLLLFHDQEGHVDEGLVPTFNTLNLFAVPRAHSVSVVAPFAREPRLSITGWFHALATLDADTQAALGIEQPNEE